MTAEQLIRERMNEQHLSIGDLSSATGVEYELMRRSLRGKRNFKNSELVDVCCILKLDMADLSATDGWEVDRDDTEPRDARDLGDGGKR